MSVFDTIRKQDNVLTKSLFFVCKKIRTLSFPCIKPLFYVLYCIRRCSIDLIFYIKEKCWNVPVFRSICGISYNDLRLPNGIPNIEGSPVFILGKGVTIRTANICSGKFRGILEVGDNTSFGDGLDIGVQGYVKIGNNVLVANNCFIMDNGGHPTEISRRRIQIEEKDIKEVEIKDGVWLGTNVVVLPGSKIGENTIVMANSVVSGRLPPNVIASGNPAKPILKLQEG